MKKEGKQTYIVFPRRSLEFLSGILTRICIKTGGKKFFKQPILPPSPPLPSAPTKKKKKKRTRRKRIGEQSCRIHRSKNEKQTKKEEERGRGGMEWRRVKQRGGRKKETSPTVMVDYYNQFSHIFISVHHGRSRASKKNHYFLSLTHSLSLSPSRFASSSSFSFP